MSFFPRKFYNYECTLETLEPGGIWICDILGKAEDYEGKSGFICVCTNTFSQHIICLLWVSLFEKIIAGHCGFIIVFSCLLFTKHLKNKFLFKSPKNWKNMRANKGFFMNLYKKVFKKYQMFTLIFLSLKKRSWWV